MTRALLVLCAAILLGTAALAQSPAPEETALFETAQKSGRVEDYQAYLERFPNGVFAEAARFELEFAGAEVPTEAMPPTDVTFTSPLPPDLAGVGGRSIAELLEGTPAFPPIEGLPEELWKDRPCGTCHKWTPEDLCTQAKTYARPDAADRLAMPHPYGPAFRRALKAFGEGGCRMQ